MTVQTDFSSPVAGTFAGERPLNPLFNRLIGWIGHRRNLARDRRDVRRLLDLAPNLLADMGLDRADIAWALTGPTDVLPSQRLQRLRANRSRARLARLGIRKR